MRPDKISVLAKYLEVDPDEITESASGFLFDVGSESYLVATDIEAEGEARDAIKESLWAFNVSFIAAHSKALSSHAAQEAFAAMQEKLCEDANPLVMGLIDDFDHFVDDAIAADGRGHFLSQYDGEEIELPGNLFLYRVG